MIGDVPLPLCVCSPSVFTRTPRDVEAPCPAPQKDTSGDQLTWWELVFTKTQSGGLGLPEGSVHNQCMAQEQPLCFDAADRVPGDLQPPLPTLPHLWSCWDAIASVLYPCILPEPPRGTMEGGCRVLVSP